MLWDRGRWIPEPGKDPRKTIEEGHLHFTLQGERMKGEWVMFRLKPKKGEKRESWMLKKVDDEFADPAHGAALVEDCTTSVTSGRTMAEIASGGTSGDPTERGARAGGRRRRLPKRRHRSGRRSSPPSSTQSRPGRTGCSNINMTATDF
jgi:bifunctional non-homologous end joining protein LigD